jgi:hypothetical protein
LKAATRPAHKNAHGAGFLEIGHRKVEDAISIEITEPN